MDGFFDDVAEDAHHGYGLVFGEAFVFEALDEFERVEVVVAVEGRGCVEGAGEGEEDGEAGGQEDVGRGGEGMPRPLLEARAGLERAPCCCLRCDGPALGPRLRVGD